MNILRNKSLHMNVAIETYDDLSDSDHIVFRADSDLFEFKFIVSEPKLTSRDNWIRFIESNDSSLSFGGNAYSSIIKRDGRIIFYSDLSGPGDDTTNHISFTFNIDEQLRKCIDKLFTEAQ